MSDNPLRHHLMAAYEQLQQLAGHRMTTDKVREKVGEAIADLQKVVDQTAWLEEILPLDELLGEGSIVTARAVSEDADAATEDSGQPLVRMIKGSDLKDQRDELRVLDGFIRWGADPLRASDYSHNGLEIARILGEHFEDLEHWITESWFQLGRDRTDFLVSVPDGVDFNQFKRQAFQLHDLGVFAKKPGFFNKKDKEKKRTFFKSSVHKRNDLKRLLRGEWLTAYAFWVVSDFIERNRLTAQITAALEFRLPIEVDGENQVDYSLLAYIEHDQRKRLIWVQCDPTNLSAGGKDVSRILSARETLDRAAKLGRVADAELDMLCIIPGNIPNSKKKAFPKTRNRLADAGIAVKTVGELKAEIQSLLVSS